MKLINFIYILAICISSVTSYQFTGKIADIPKNWQLFQGDKIVNGENLPIRFSIKLKSYQGDVISALVNKDYEFTFNNLDQGVYDLSINTHDFLLKSDRFKIEINDTTVLATDYYLTNEFTGTPTNITEKPLLLQVINTKQYYEAGDQSVKALVMNSPLGFIFKNTAYTIMFVFVVVMMVAPYILQLVAPDVAKRLNEIHAEQAESRLVDKEEKPAKIEEISRTSNPSNIRKRKN